MLFILRKQSVKKKFTEFDFLLTNHCGLSSIGSIKRWWYATAISLKRHCEMRPRCWFCRTKSNNLKLGSPARPAPGRWFQHPSCSTRPLALAGDALSLLISSPDWCLAALWDYLWPMIHSPLASPTSSCLWQLQVSPNANRSEYWP